MEFLLQVPLPGSITPRHGHSAVVFENGFRFRIVVLFGGKQPSRLLGEGKNTQQILLCIYRFLCKTLTTDLDYTHAKGTMRP